MKSERKSAENAELFLSSTPMKAIMPSHTYTQNMASSMFQFRS